MVIIIIHVKQIAKLKHKRPQILVHLSFGLLMESLHHFIRQTDSEQVIFQLNLNETGHSFIWLKRLDLDLGCLDMFSLLVPSHCSRRASTEIADITFVC